MIPDSMNPRQMAENILELQRQIKEAGSELPTPGVGDTGKILKVGASGYELGNELVPTPTVADENKIIKVNSQGAYALATEYSYTPPSYSETEFNTGKKWIDGKDVYCRVFKDVLPVIAESMTININIMDYDSIIGLSLLILRTDNTIFPYTNYAVLKATNNYYLRLYSVGTSFSEGTYTSIIYYTKPSVTPDITPSPDDGNRSVPEENNEEPVEEVKTTRKRSTSSK